MNGETSARDRVKYGIPRAVLADTLVTQEPSRPDYARVEDAFVAIEQDEQRHPKAWDENGRMIRLPTSFARRFFIDAPDPIDWR